MRVLWRPSGRGRFFRLPPALWIPSCWIIPICDIFLTRGSRERGGASLARPFTAQLLIFWWHHRLSRRWWCEVLGDGFRRSVGHSPRFPFLLPGFAQLSLRDPFLAA